MHFAAAARCPPARPHDPKSLMSGIGTVMTTLATGKCSPVVASDCQPTEPPTPAMRSVAPALNRPCLRFPSGRTATDAKSVLGRTGV